VKPAFACIRSSLSRIDSTTASVLSPNEMPEVIDFMGFQPEEIYYQKLKDDMCIVPLALNQLTSIAVPNKLINCAITSKIIITSALTWLVELAKRFPESFHLCKSGSVESLSETIVGVLADQSNINNVLSRFYKFSRLYYANFSKILKLIKIFISYDRN
jgi:hypothetical protein